MESDRYVQMASDFQVPCLMMCSNGTPCLKAQEAPALLNAWNVKEGNNFKALDVFLRCLRACESVSGTRPLAVWIVNNGSLASAGISSIIRLIALIGQRGEVPRDGRGMVTVDFLSCMVLDHFNSRTALSPDLMKSPLARCLVVSKAATECGSILESLRKEKKHVRYNGRKIFVSQYISKDCNFSISTIGRIVGSKGALSLSAFKYN